MGGSGGGEGGQGAGGSEDQKIKVGEKEYGADDIQNLISDASSGAQKVEKAARVLDAAKAYGLEPEDFLQQATGAFSVLQGLITDGVLDDQGRVVKQTPKGKGEGDDEGDDDDFDLEKLFKPEGNKGDLDVSGLTKGSLLALVQAYKTLTTEVGTLKSRLGETDEFASSLARQNLEDKIIAKFDNLKPEDVQKLFGQAASLRGQGKKPDLFELAKSASEKKAGDIVGLNKAFAEKHGLDYEKIMKEAEKDPNKLKEFDASQIPSVQAGKTISREAGEDKVHPAQALRELIDHRLHKGT